MLRLTETLVGLVLAGCFGQQVNPGLPLAESDVTGCRACRGKNRLPPPPALARPARHETAVTDDLHMGTEHDMTKCFYHKEKTRYLTKQGKGRLDWNLAT